MATQTRQFVSRCDLCKSSKPSNQVMRPPMGKQIIMNRPFQQIYIDLLGPYPSSKEGNTSLFICMDNLTKFVLLKPLRKANSKNIIDYLVKDVFSIFSTPEFVFSDNGKQFISDLFKKMLDQFGIRQLKPPYYSPQANASERVNRSIIAAIRTYMKDDHREWDRHIHHIASSLRSSIHSAIKTSPFQALFDLCMVQHGSQYEILKRLHCLNEEIKIDNPINDKIQLLHNNIKNNFVIAHKQYEMKYNLRSKPITFQVGQEIFKRNFILSDKNKRLNSKFCKKFTKCRIRSIVGLNRYELENLNGSKTLGVYHAKDLRA